MTLILSVPKCLICNKNLPVSCSKFCSIRCKAASQILRKKYTCCGCGISFYRLPYLERKLSYCSNNCYLETTSKRIIKKCIVCNKMFKVKRYSIVQGHGLFCSRECYHTSYPTRIKISCKQCGKIVEVPPSKANLVKYCSKKCMDDHMRHYVKSKCKQCNKIFQLPLSDWNRGRGSFCNYNCFMHYRGETSIETKVKRSLDLYKIPYIQEFKIGSFRVDFLLLERKIVIECDGTYWHSRKIAKERDKRKNKFLKQNGYRLIRLNEQTINHLKITTLGEWVINYF